MRRFSLLCSLLIPAAIALVPHSQAQSLPAPARSESSPAHPDTAPAPQIPRDAWKDCLYNNEIIRCRDEQSETVLLIIWVDGIRTRLEPRPPVRPGLPIYWADRYGGLWRREVLIQGNSLLTNLGTGNRILLPLRYPCKPPLKGEVGYCRY